MEKIQSAFLKLSSNDVVKGFIVAMLATIVAAIHEGLTAYGLNLMAYDWAGILDLAWKAGLAYLLKNWMSDSSGRVLGKI